uniref:tetratricopeptide repeat-containing sensor histidine kinase n=3 Tax=Flavobacterium sp. TaxID=239 RepID=UPI004049F869
MQSGKILSIQFKKRLYFIFLSIVLLTVSSCEKTTNQSESTVENKTDLVTIEDVNKLYRDFDTRKQIDIKKIIDSALIAKGNDTLGKEYALNLLLVSLKSLQNENNIPASEAYFKRFMNHPKAQKNPDFEIFYKITQADWFTESNEKLKSRAALDEVLPKVGEEKNPYLFYYAKFTEANLLCEEYQYLKGIDLLIYVYDNIKEKPELGINKYSVLNNIGLYFNEIKKYDKAMEYLSLAHKELYKSDRLRDMYIIYSNMGNVLSNQNKKQASIDTLLKAIDINTKLNRKSSNIIAFYNIGLSYVEIENYAKANQYFQQGLDLSESINFEIGYCYHNYGLGHSYLKSKDYALSLKHLKLAIKYSRKFENKAILSNSLSDLIEIARLQNDYKTVSDNTGEYWLLQEEYQEYVLNEQIEEMVLKMDVEKINAKNKLLSQEIAFNEKINKNKTLLIYAQSIIVLLILISVFLLYRSNKKKQRINEDLKKQKVETEKANKNLISLIADRDNLVKTIIHDLRNPLSAIKGCSTLMSIEADESEKEMLLNMLNSSANRLDMLISSLLNSYTADEDELHNSILVKTKVNGFIKNMIENFEFEAKLKNIVLNSYLEPLELSVNQNALFSVVGNLISNAIKYSPKNTMVKISLLNEKKYWKIIVSDQGPGFADEDLSKMFQLQTPLSSNPTGNEISTGIGLYSVKKTVERYNGTVVLNPDYKKGAEFICTFPK